MIFRDHIYVQKVCNRPYYHINILETRNAKPKSDKMNWTYKSKIYCKRFLENIALDNDIVEATLLPALQ